MATEVEQKRSERIAVRLRPSLKERAELLAQNEDRTLSAWIERLIKHAVENGTREAA
jgi:predicted HicB family RNase H-like nuclease